MYDSYTVKENDTLESLARKFNISVWLGCYLFLCYKTYSIFKIYQKTSETVN